jgi:hypothetical protein
VVALAKIILFFINAENFPIFIFIFKREKNYEEK